MREIPLFDSFAAKALLIWACAAAAIVAFLVWKCDGHFVLALDDPYISLSLAHNLLAGHYGINAHEASSPSSSILWPWLLTLTEALRLGALGPLALNMAAGAGSLLVALRLLRTHEVIDPIVAPGWAAGTVAVLAFVVSPLSLSFIGLEHSLHILASLLALEALALACDGRAVRPVDVVAIAALPLIRLEGAALWLSAVVALWAIGRRREALIAAALGGLGLGLNAAYVTGLGLPLLPSSVLVKTKLTLGADSGIGAFAAHLAHKLAFDLVYQRAGALLALLGVLGWIVARPAARVRAPLYLAVGFALAAHLAFGAYGWFSRYEVYAVAIGALAVLVGLGERFGAPGRPLLAAAPRLPPMPGFLAAGMLTLLAAPYAQATLFVPAAAANIYSQQEQMRRLALEFYPRPVAVNDIGLVSWGNPNYVLDLWGLGSEAARKLRAAHSLTPAAMARLADDHGVELVMIYDHLFEGAPASWRPIADLVNAETIVTSPDVAIYLTPKGDLTAALDALARLGATLPHGTRIVLRPDLAAAASLSPADAERP